jgi:protein-S-isoprenylcysteine O-methyltransferase Ste14
MNADSARNSAHNSVWRIAEVIFGIPFLASIAFQGLIPFGLPEGIPRQILIPVGIILVTIGVGSIVSARREFARYTQPTDPGLPTTRIIQTGVFATSRNPLYFGSVLVITGIALMLNMLWALVALLLSIILCHRILIVPEEKYLIAKFGKEYKDYMVSVHRWFGRKRSKIRKSSV